MPKIITGFCELCDRDVGLLEAKPLIAIIIFIILGLVIPVWIITLPIFWGIAIFLYLKRGKKHCAICKSPVKISAS